MMWMRLISRFDWPRRGRPCRVYSTVRQLIATGSGLRRFIPNSQRLSRRCAARRLAGTMGRTWRENGFSQGKEEESNGEMAVFDYLQHQETKSYFATSRRRSARNLVNLADVGLRPGFRPGL